MRGCSYERGESVTHTGGIGGGGGGMGGAGGGGIGGGSGTGGLYQYASSPVLAGHLSSHQYPSHISIHPPHTHTHTHSSTLFKPTRTSHDNIDNKRNYTYDKKEAMRQFVRKYRARYEVNPFRKEDSSGFLKTQTHNRRRWSHIFPAGSK